MLMKENHLRRTGYAMKVLQNLKRLVCVNELSKKLEYTFIWTTVRAYSAH